MNPPTSPRPYDIHFKSESRYYGKVENLTLIEGLEKAWAIDKLRHTLEWLEYEAHITKLRLAEAEKDYEEYYG
jgi:hypothetical protein